jgi:hypothetical protein
LELGFMALLGESFSVINEPAQQALSYYTIHEFWAHVPTAPPPFLFLEMDISFTLHMSLTINAVFFETHKGYKLTLPGVFPLFNHLLLPQANGPAACVDSGCTHPFKDSNVKMVQLGCLEVYTS